MNEREKIIKLYFIYKSLLTKKQIEYFKDYYLEDLSMSEISENYNVSKAAVAKTLKTIENKLNTLEKNLNILKKEETIENIMKSTLDKNIKKELEKLLR